MTVPRFAASPLEGINISTELIGDVVMIPKKFNVEDAFTDLAYVSPDDSVNVKVESAEIVAELKPNGSTKREGYVKGIILPP